MTKALEATTFPKWKGEIDPETNLWLDIEIKLYANHKLLPNLKNVEPISILRIQRINFFLGLFIQLWGWFWSGCILLSFLLLEDGGGHLQGKIMVISLINRVKLVLMRRRFMCSGRFCLGATLY